MTVSTSPRRAISSSAAATAAAAEARETAVTCCSPRVSLMMPWLAYSRTALLAMNFGEAWLPTGPPPLVEPLGCVYSTWL